MRTSAIILILVLLIGCKRQGELHFSGLIDYTYNGVQIELPENGKGKIGATPNQMDYRWDQKVLTVRDLGDGTVLVNSPVVKDQVVDKTMIISFDSEGNMKTRKNDKAK